MTVKQNTRKRGNITRSERASATEHATSVLKDVKERAGAVIHIAISDRTTLELPANLTQEEIDARVEKYINLYKSKR